MATLAELFRLNSEVRKDTSPKVSRTFSKIESVISDYAGLLTGNGYDFYALPNPYTAVAGAKPALIPMIISVVPPETWPTGEVTTREVSFPSEQEITLTSFRERFVDKVGQGRSVTQIVPVDPAISQRVDQLTQEVLALETRIDKTDPPDEELVRRRDVLSSEIDSLISNIRYTEIDVPVGSTVTQERQKDQVSGFLQSVRDRYETFQGASALARAQLRDRRSITGPLKQDEKDVQATDIAVRLARSKTVRGDLEYLKEQAERMLNLPPLFMYINPESWQTSYDFIVSDGNKTRDGYVVEFWGEQQPKVAASGKVGAFYVDAKDRLGYGAGGLAVGARKGSYAYQQFMALFQAYRSNGYIFNADKSIALVGSVSIFYDGVIYTGSFDNFAITHSEDSPFTMDYSFGFTVRFAQKIR